MANLHMYTHTCIQKDKEREREGGGGGEIPFQVKFNVQNLFILGLSS